MVQFGAAPRDTGGYSVGLAKLGQALDGSISATFPTALDSLHLRSHFLTRLGDNTRFSCRGQMYPEHVTGTIEPSPASEGPWVG